MKGLTKIIFYFVLVFIGIAIYKDFTQSWNTGQSASSATGSQPQNPAARDPDMMYALRAADNTWPAIEASQEVVSDDLSRNNYYLVFDGSGSMGDRECASGKTKIRVAKSAMVDFVSKVPNDANIGLLVFDNNGTRERVALGQNAKERTIEEIGKVHSGGGTPLDSAIRLAYKSLTRQAKSQLGYGEYHLVVVTDGEASKGQNPASIVESVTSKSPVVLHTIGFCISGKHSLNQAGITLYKSANNPLELARGLDSVLAEATDFSVDAFDGQVQ